MEELLIAFQLEETVEQVVEAVVQLALLLEVQVLTVVLPEEEGLLILKLTNLEETGELTPEEVEVVVLTITVITKEETEDQEL